MIFTSIQFHISLIHTNYANAWRCEQCRYMKLPCNAMHTCFDSMSFKFRGSVLALHAANPVARCYDLSWRNVVLWLLGVYVNFRVI